MDATPATADRWESSIHLLPVGLTVSHYPTDDPAEGYLVAANPAASRTPGFDLQPFVGVIVAPENVDDRALGTLINSNRLCRVQTAVR